MSPRAWSSKLAKYVRLVQWTAFLARTTSFTNTLRPHRQLWRLFIASLHPPGDDSIIMAPADDHATMASDMMRHTFFFIANTPHVKKPILLSARLTHYRQATTDNIFIYLRPYAPGQIEWPDFADGSARTKYNYTILQVDRRLESAKRLAESYCM